jgi:hypothetical protein
VKPVDSFVVVVEFENQSITSSTSAVADSTTGPDPHRLPFVTMGSAKSGLDVKAPETGDDGQLVVLLVMTTL